jgi:hypothetical protein
MIWKFNLQLCNGTRVVYKDRCRYRRRRSLSSRKRFKSLYIKEMKISGKKTKLKLPITNQPKVTIRY